MIIDFLLYISLILILLKILKKIAICGISPLDPILDTYNEIELNKKFYSTILASVYILCVLLICSIAVAIIPLTIVYTPINFFQENIISTSHLFFIDMYLLFLLIKYSSYINTKTSLINSIYFILILAFFSVNIIMTIEPGMY